MSSHTHFEKNHSASNSKGRLVHPLNCDTKHCSTQNALILHADTFHSGQCAHACTLTPLAADLNLSDLRQILRMDCWRETWFDLVC